MSVSNIRLGLVFNKSKDLESVTKSTDNRLVDVWKYKRINSVVIQS